MSNIYGVIPVLNLNVYSSASLTQHKDRVIASGVALLLAYTVNFLFQTLITFFRTEGRAGAMRKLTEASLVMYWFGVASMFSIFPPFYYGAFNAIIAYVTLVIVIMMHAFCLSDKKVGDRQLFTIFYFFYHLLIAVWILVGLILAYIWSNIAYQNA